MVKYGMSILDDIEMMVFTDHAERAEALDFLRASGISEIRGLAIEDRLVEAAKVQSSHDKIRSHRRALQKAA